MEAAAKVRAAVGVTSVLKESVSVAHISGADDVIGIATHAGKIRTDYAPGYERRTESNNCFSES